MNIIESAKKELENFSLPEGYIADVGKDGIDLLLGDKTAIVKILAAIVKLPFFFRDRWLWSKLELFLQGAYVNEDDCATMRAKLMEGKESTENAERLLACIDRAETKQKIQYVINATRCLLTDFIDLTTYFRICHSITYSLDEDLRFLAEMIEHYNLEYSINVQGLLTNGLMYQSIIEPDGNQKYSFTPIARLVDQYAVSYDNVARYPNPIVCTKSPNPHVSVPAMGLEADIVNKQITRLQDSINKKMNIEVSLGEPSTIKPNTLHLIAK